MGSAEYVAVTKPHGLTTPPPGLPPAGRTFSRQASSRQNAGSPAGPGLMQPGRTPARGSEPNLKRCISCVKRGWMSRPDPTRLAGPDQTRMADARAANPHGGSGDTREGGCWEKRRQGTGRAGLGWVDSIRSRAAARASAAPARTPGARPGPRGRPGVAKAKLPANVRTGYGQVRHGRPAAAMQAAGGSVGAGDGWDWCYYGGRCWGKLGDGGGPGRAGVETLRRGDGRKRTRRIRGDQS